MTLTAEELATRTWNEFGAIAPAALPPLRGEHDLVSMGARFVYLDSFCWQYLADGRFGRGDFPYEKLRQSVWDGALVLPLSQTHFAELGRFHNPRRRAEVIVAMLELSGMVVVDFDDFQAWDAYVGLCVLHDLERDLGRRRLNWGYESAFVDCTELDGAVATRSIRSEWRRWSEMPWQRAVSMPGLISSDLLSQQISWMCAVDPGPMRGRSEFIDAQEHVQKLLREVPPDVRESVHALHLVRQLLPMAPYLELASALLDVECPTSSLEELRAVVAGMPITRVWSAMLRQAHENQTNRNWHKRQSDQIDFVNLSVAAALFDLVIVDKPTSVLVEGMPDGMLAAEVTNDLYALLRSAGPSGIVRTAA